MGPPDLAYCRILRATGSYLPLEVDYNARGMACRNGRPARGDRGRLSRMTGTVDVRHWRERA
jgi:hypothetical protein